MLHVWVFNRIGLAGLENMIPTAQNDRLSWKYDVTSMKITKEWDVFATKIIECILQNVTVAWVWYLDRVDDFLSESSKSLTRMTSIMMLWRLQMRKCFYKTVLTYFDRGKALLEQNASISSPVLNTKCEDHTWRHYYKRHFRGYDVIVVNNM